MRTPETLQSLVDGLADRLQRSVAIDDPKIRLIAASKHYGDEDAGRVQSLLGRGVDEGIRERLLAHGIETAEGPLRLPAEGTLGIRARLCVPVRCNDVLLGYLWLIEEKPLTDEEVTAAAQVAEAVGLALYRTDVAFERRQAAADALLRGLFSDQTATRTAAVTEIQEEGLLHDTRCVRVLGVRVVLGDDESRAAEVEASLLQMIKRLLASFPDGAAIALAHRRQLTLLVSGDIATTDASLQSAATWTVGELAEATGLRCIAGIGAVQQGLGEAHQSYEQARTTLRTAQIMPVLGDVVGWESLGVFALLARLSPSDVNLAAYPPALQRLARDRNARVLLETVETYLDLAGDAQATAAALFVHRATLYQRISRIEEISGLSMRNGTDRLTLHLCIKLARLAGHYDELVGGPAPSEP